MPNHEGLIRYLMKEMDPSEEVEFERSMMEDDDLLIEVESLRKTLQKTQALPHIHPPQHVTESVLNKAKQYRSKKLLSNRILSLPYINYAAAAVIIIAMGVGLTFVQWGNEDSSTNASTVNALQPNTSNVQPWVDKNNVLNVADGYNSNSSQPTMYLDDEWARSANKLKAAGSTAAGAREPSKDIKLTGSSN